MRSDFEGVWSNFISWIEFLPIIGCMPQWASRRMFPNSNIHEKQKFVSLPSAYAAQGKPKQWYLSAVQCFCCEEFGRCASHCLKKFYSYCLKDGQFNKECSIRPPRTATAFTAATGPSTATSSANQNVSTLVKHFDPPKQSHKW